MKTRIFMATGFCNIRNGSLNKVNNKQRLVSYWYYKEGKVDPEFIPKLVTTGLGTEKVKKEKNKNEPVESRGDD